jgi:type II secretory pathway component PulF
MVLPIVVLNIAAFVFPVPGFIVANMAVPQYLEQVVRTLLSFYIPVAAVVLLVKFSGNRGLVRRVLDGAVLWIPVLGSAVREMALARYCHAFSMMARAGISVVTTAQSAAELCGNAAIAGRLAGGAEAARAGNAVMEGFSSRLPLEFIEMWRVGEETGEMAAVAERMARRYQERAEAKFVEVARWLPRIFYFFVCLMIIRMIFKLAGTYMGTLEGIGDI